MKTLVIAEKPSVGRDIARVLRCGQKGDGYLFGGDYTVSWAIGHLASLMNPEDYDDAYKKWRMETLPIIPKEMRCKAIGKTRSQLKILHKLMNDPATEMIICATDSGREGELIFRYIYQLTKCIKPFQRLWISSMTDAAIQEGFARLRDGHDYDALYRSAKCRAEADWLVGMNATRAYTIQYGVLLSVGRVQTPTLAVLTERQKEINAFVPSDYWEVKAVFTASEERSYPGLWFMADGEGQQTKISEREKAMSIADKVRGQQGIIERITTEDKRQPPPQLFDLTELQRECNRKLGYSAQKTLSIAQALYEKHKLITYPRTDSRYLSEDMVPKLKSAIKSLSFTEAYREAAVYLEGLEKLPVTNRIVNGEKVTDHHAIIPTGVKMPSGLAGEEKAVYDRIVRKFLAAFYPAYLYQATTVITVVKEEHFQSTGQTVTAAGWTVLYAHEKNEAEESGGAKAKTGKGKAQDGDTERAAPLPALTQGEAVETTEVVVLKKKTQPPKAYTEATLLSAMEHAGRFVEDEALKEKLKESGLGTPATRAAIIERLIEVGYVVRQRKNLMPTEKGMKLIEVTPAELRSPETTGKWERGLSRIAKGDMDEQRFMESIHRYVSYIVKSAAAGDAAQKKVLFPKEEMRRSGKRAAQKPVPGICECPLCRQGEILENSKAYYCSRWREDCPFKLWKSTLEREGKKVEDATVRDICEGMRSAAEGNKQKP